MQEMTDKNMLGNCTYVRCFSLRYLEDRKAMAAALDVPLQAISELETTEGPTHTTINYIERDFRVRNCMIIASEAASPKPI